jgi:hypothetical protein
MLNAANFRFPPLYVEDAATANGRKVPSLAG